jgi:polyisoprenoid-binding protein YceI
VALKSPAFFEVAKYPVARFVSTSVKSGGEGGATNTVIGELELHGVKKSIDIPVSLHVRPNGVDVDAEFVIRWKDFDLIVPSKYRAKLANDVVISVLVVAEPVP